MTHSSSEGQSIDKLQVLVIAERAIADRICLRFRGEKMDIQVKSPPTWEQDLGWLIHLLFSDSSGDAQESLGNECSLFAWNRFDIVILTDIWWAHFGESRTRYAAGRVFALWDNNRGNFGTRKIVLHTDSDDFESMARSALNEAGRISADSENSSATLSEEIDRALDPKRSVAFVNASSDDFLSQLESWIYRPAKLPLQSPPREGKQRRHDRISKAAENLTRPVVKTAGAALRKSIRHTQIFAIDDEQSALTAIYEALTGDNSYKAPPEISSELTVKILNLRTKTTSHAKTFDDLDEVSMGEASLALQTVYTQEGKKEEESSLRDVVFVTDILFELGDSTRTGIDIIRSLRKMWNNRIGIIAFTGFTTPFIAMTAYRQGADFVIQKDGAGGRHDSLQLSGLDRLVEALATLSFQRSYLRRIRQYCLNRVDNLEADQLPNAIRHLIWLFERTLPLRTVSLHMQQEWEDTYWLLKTVQTGNGVKPKEARVVLNEFKKKY